MVELRINSLNLDYNYFVWLNFLCKILLSNFHININTFLSMIKTNQLIKYLSFNDLSLSNIKIILITIFLFIFLRFTSNRKEKNN